MAEAVLFDFAKFALEKLGSAAVDELKSVLGVEDEIKSIKSNMSSIQAVLSDAEKQQSTSESIKNWLWKLQDVMYDMDDLLDDISTEFKIKDKNKGQWRKQVRKFFSRTNSLVLRWNWAQQIKSLRKKLDRIADEKKNFVLTESIGLHSLESDPRETHSMVGRSELILGRDEDKEAIINSILNCGDREDLSVLPVVGFGAIGKTTLARLVYNDSRIDDNFDQKLWVYVSEKYSMKRVLKQVISVATGESILQLSMEQPSLEQLRIKTSEALQGKKYFLVLDDLWNKDSNEWRKLREMLDVGAEGSTVLATTRESDVASIVGSVDEYRLRELSHDTCLEIFQRLAFKEGEEVEPKLLDLAKEIVGKSKGLPLLVNTLGNLLRGQKDEKEWRTTIQKLEQGHDDILKMLKLSYDQLPSYMKLCFHTLSIYEKGEELYKFYNMLPLWMALGFLPDDEGRESLGSKCLMEMLSKSLLMKDSLGGTQVDLGYIHPYRMHDFVHDLAKSLAGEELVIINNSTKEVSEKVRYVALDEGVSLGKSCLERLLNQAKEARLLKINDQSLNKAFLETIISRFQFLRVLDLRGCQFDELPRKIGYMKHLRFLNLTANESMKQLPDSICNLINLQSLIIGHCTSLRELPANIGRLENLKFLSVSVQSEVLPEGMGQIKGLQSLFLINCPRLAFLLMSIEQLENLENLVVWDCEVLDLAHGSWSLDGLTSLRTLSLNKLPKLQKLPIGVKAHPFTPLRMLAIMDCANLTEIGDGIGYLTSLKCLVIINCPRLMGLPQTICFDKLELLIIDGCPSLCEKFEPVSSPKSPWIRIDNQRIIKGDIQSRH